VVCAVYTVMTKTDRSRVFVRFGPHFPAVWA